LAWRLRFFFFLRVFRQCRSSSLPPIGPPNPKDTPLTMLALDTQSWQQQSRPTSGHRLTSGKGGRRGRAGGASCGRGWQRARPQICAQAPARKLWPGSTKHRSGRGAICRPNSRQRSLGEILAEALAASTVNATSMEK